MYQISLRWLACDSGNLFVAMQPSDPDVVIVGAGIAGASLATVLARSGLEVVLLERQREYSDRVRGEYMAMWGVLEARELGLEDVLASTGAVTARYSVPYDELLPPAGAEAAVRDMSTLLPGVAGALCASHPNACQALAEEAARSGAKVVSGVANVRVEAGTRPSVSFQNGAAREVRPRLVVGADGRTSTVRVQCGIEQRRAAPTHLIAGMLVEGVPSWPDDHYHRHQRGPHRDRPRQGCSSGPKRLLTAPMDVDGPQAVIQIGVIQSRIKCTRLSRIRTF